MARKIDLKGAYNAGTLVFSTNASEAVTSDGPSALFNGEDTSLKLVLNNPNAPFTEVFTLTFNTPIPADKIRIKTTHRLVSDFDIQINGDSNTDINVTDSTPTVKKSTVNDFNLKGISSIQYTLNAAFGSLPNTYEFYEIELFILDEADPYEFNDSVLSTKGWNSSRYDGRQLQGSQVNEYTAGDISYGNTPVVRNINKTFYVATEIVSLSKSGSAAEDTSLQYIPNFSYIIVDKVITVNDDDTLTQVSINDIPDNTEGANNLTGLKREFQTNIPQGSQIGIINFDESVKNRSNKNYDVYFNRGRLQPILRFTGNSSITTFGRPIINTTSVSLYAGGQPSVQGSFTATNRKLVQEFYTGSFETLQKGAVDTESIENFFFQLINHRNTVDQRYFITVLNTSGSGFSTSIDTEPIRTIDTDAINTVAPSKNLAELSTTEIFNYEGGSIIDLDIKFPLNRSYNPGLANGDGNQYSGSFDITALNEEKPALLINMNKEIELPDGKGSKPIVVVPENLHPFVKDNLIHFCAKAGLDIGDRKVVPALNESRRNLK